MANVCDKRSFMIGLDKEMEIVVEIDKVSVEVPQESEFILKDLPRVVEITKSTT